MVLAVSFSSQLIHPFFHFLQFLKKFTKLNFYPYLLNGLFYFGFANFFSYQLIFSVISYFRSHNSSISLKTLVTKKVIESLFMKFTKFYCSNHSELVKTTMLDFASLN